MKIFLLLFIYIFANITHSSALSLSEAAAYAVEQAKLAVQSGRKWYYKTTTPLGIHIEDVNLFWFSAWPNQFFYKEMERYKVPFPWHIKKEEKFTLLEDMHHCKCPRVYYPVCGWDNVTYVNHCILNCAKIDLRREGPCLLYRRNNPLSPVVLPKVWASIDKNETVIEVEAKDLINASFPSFDQFLY